MSLAAIVILTACPKVQDVEDIPYEEAKTFIHEELKYLYYWNDEIPDKVDYRNPVEIENFYNSLLVTKDHWSWMQEGKEYISDEMGVSYGTFGASLSQAIKYHNDYDVKVRYVIPNSPFDKAGVTRGWTITHIDGQSKDDLVNSGKFTTIFNNSNPSDVHEFVFLDTEGKQQVRNIQSAAVLNMRPALIATIFDGSSYQGLNERVGYFNYLGFQAGNDAFGKPMIDDIKENMQMFKSAGIKKLILDLRYNGGGDSRASDTLVNYLAPKSAIGKTYVTRTHNQDLSKENESFQIKRIIDKSGNDLSLDLDALYIITGPGSASASEMVLNGLMPLMKVEQVGDTTYGKPNGMYVVYYPASKQDYEQYNHNNFAGLEYVFLPIAFYNKNGLGENIPDDGIKPGLGARPDDIYHDFGPQEDNISACLYHIINGKYPQLPQPSRFMFTKSNSSRNANLEPENRDKHYGKFYDVENHFIINNLDN